MSVDTEKTDRNPWPVPFPLSEITPFPLPDELRHMVTNLKSHFPGLYQRYPHGDILVVSYFSDPIPFGSLGSASFEELLLRQRTARFHSRALIPLADYKKMFTYDVPKPFFDKDTFRSLGYTDHDLEPDVSDPELTGMREREVNKLLVARLVTDGEVLSAYPTVANIIRLCQNRGAPFDSNALRRGFIDVFNTETLRGLMEKKYITREQISALIQNAPVWLSELTLLAYRLEVQNRAKHGSYHMPFAVDFNVQKGVPPLEALPHILNAQAMYVAGLPDVIPEGRMYPLDTISAGLQETDRFAHHVLEHALRTRIQRANPGFTGGTISSMMQVVADTDPAFAARVLRMERLYNETSYFLTALIEQYASSPHLLNKIIKQPSHPNLPASAIAAGIDKLLSRISPDGVIARSAHMIPIEDLQAICVPDISPIE